MSDPTAVLEHTLAEPVTRISALTVSRLYNLGNYEHVRYEITVQVAPGDSASKALIGAERLLAGLAPLKTLPSLQEIAQLERERDEIAAMTPEAWQLHWSNTEGATLVEEIATRTCAATGAKTRREAMLARAQRARELFDDLGGAATFTDVKLDWEGV
jgi:hypothetical protein